MRNSLVALSLLVAGWHQAFATLQMNGTPFWSVTKPDCTLEVVGAIQNVAPPNTVSGPVKIALWATSGPFPSPGVIVAEALVGVVPGGGQVLDFSSRVPVDVSGLTGNYQFTIVLMENLGGSWFNRTATPSGAVTLDRGDFLDGSQWNVRTSGYKRPRGVAVDKTLRLKAKANGSFNSLVPGTEADFTVRFTSDINASLKRGSNIGFANYVYKRGRDSLKGRRFRTGRLSLFSDDVREAEIVLFFLRADKGVYRFTGGGRVNWGEFVLR